MASAATRSPSVQALDGLVAPRSGTACRCTLFQRFQPIRGLHAHGWHELLGLKLRDTVDDRKAELWGKLAQSDHASGDCLVISWHGDCAERHWPGQAFEGID